MSTFENLTVCVPRGGANVLRNAVLVTTPIPAVPDNHIVFRIDRFGFSSNNVTYGALGENEYFRYFDFYPAPETETTSPSTHGIIPVWGFGTVVASTVPGVNVGERLYGYLPMARYALFPIDVASITENSIHMPLGEMPADRRAYKQLLRCKDDPTYREDKENETMLYRPLFWTAHWFEDKLNIEEYYKARRVLISSASAKTAFCIAYKIRQRAMKGVEVIGLTSSKNMAFTKGLGLFDHVLTYDQVPTLNASDGPWVYVDIAGNTQLNKQILEHLSGHIASAFTIGMTKVLEGSDPTANSLDKSESTESTMTLFFTPAHLMVRRQQLSPEEFVAVQKAAWSSLMKDCIDWVRVQTTGGDGVLEKYQETVDGKVGPNEGLVFSLWNEDKSKL